MQNKDNNKINLKQAAEIFKEVTGRSISRRTIHDELYRRPHLGHFRFTEAGREALAGVRRDRWEYFVKARCADSGPDDIFHENDNPWGE